MTAAPAIARPWGQIRDPRPPRCPYYTVRFTHEGKAHERTSRRFTTRAAAESALRRAQALLDCDDPAPIETVLSKVFGGGKRRHARAVVATTFRDLAPRYYEWAEKDGKRESTLRGDASRIRIASAAAWAGKPLVLVTARDLGAWIVERQKATSRTRERARRPGETLSAFRKARKTSDRMETVEIPGADGPTINRDLAIVSAVCEWAAHPERAYVPKGTNPTRDVERRDENPNRETFLAAGEARAFILATPGPSRNVVEAALHTGMRRGELFALAWRDVALDGRDLFVRPENEKAGRGRHVPMTDGMHALLTALRAKRPRPALDGSDLVFVQDDEDASAMTETVLRRAFGKAAKALPAEKRAGFRFHDLRHTAASLLVAAGIPLLDVSRILGHSDPKITMRYAHFAPESGRAAAMALGNALAGVSREKPAAEKAEVRRTA